MISRYPEFSRGNIDIDESITMELCHQSYPKGYDCLVQQTKPEPRTMKATQFGGEKRIYLHMFVFYEDLIDYRIAALEHER